jgi:flavin reductase (DIM6/NTAB) family NADH-FMN oxidoreductase RutF
MPDIADVAPARAATADQPRADLITRAAGGGAPSLQAAGPDATGSKATDPEVTGPAVTGAEFRNAMGHFATGVTVVTSLGSDGQPVGTTANAVSSLSLDPPLVLVCFDLGSLTLQAIRGHGAFVVNILAATQRRLSANFAHRGLAAAWDGVRHRHGLTGSPRLEDVLAVMECTVEHSLPGGDHEIVVGRVRHVEISASPDAPLVYFRGGYASLAS